MKHKITVSDCCGAEVMIETIYEYYNTGNVNFSGFPVKERIPVGEKCKCSKCKQECDTKTITCTPDEEIAKALNIVNKEIENEKQMAWIIPHIAKQLNIKL